VEVKKVASYHIRISRGSKGKGTPHAEYIFREGKYSRDALAKYDDLIFKSAGNMPSWAESNPIVFWSSSDKYERDNGNVYREIEVALPRELGKESQINLVNDFIKQHLGDKHTYQFAIHCPKASLDGGDQPHAHIMYSERILDGIERAPDEFFKRYNSKNPKRGGCKKRIKDDAKWIVSVRELWANVQNQHLEQHGIAQRVDHRSLKEQGIDRSPETHLGAKHIKYMTSEVKAQFLEERFNRNKQHRQQEQAESAALRERIKKERFYPELRPNSDLEIHNYCHKWLALSETPPTDEELNAELVWISRAAEKKKKDIRAGRDVVNDLYQNTLNRMTREIKEEKSRLYHELRDELGASERVFNAHQADEPAEPSGLLASFKQKQYQADYASWAAIRDNLKEGIGQVKKALQETEKASYHASGEASLKIVERYPMLDKAHDVADEQRMKEREMEWAKKRSQSKNHERGGYSR
jgi:hypothetical protein